MPIVDFHYPNGENVPREASVRVPPGWRGPRTFQLLTEREGMPFHVFAEIPVEDDAELSRHLVISITFDELPTHGTDRAEYIIPPGWFSTLEKPTYASVPVGSVVLKNNDIPPPDPLLGFAIQLRLRVVERGGTLRLTLALPPRATALALRRQQREEMQGVRPCPMSGLFSYHVAHGRGATSRTIPRPLAHHRGGHARRRCR